MATSATLLPSPSPLALASPPKSALSGSPFSPLPALPLCPPTSRRPLTVFASSAKKINVKEPYGPGGGAKYKGGLDASGRKAKGKGVYQFAKKYGANVDGYSPIYTPEEWSASGDVYAGGPSGLTIWAVTLGAILLGGALLVFNTSALAQ